MAAMEFSFYNKSLPLTEKENHQKPGNYPIQIKISVCIYEWMNIIIVILSKKLTDFFLVT